MSLTKSNRKKVRKVVKGLKKASKLHAGQARTLSKLVKNGKRKKS